MNKQLKNILKVAAFSALMGSSGISHAVMVTGQLDTVYEQDIWDLDLDGDTWETIPVDVTIDFIPFTVNSAGVVTIDSLSYEQDAWDHDGDGDTWEFIDVNSDGEIAYFDVQLFIYRDDANLGADDFITANDNDFVNTYSDGSIAGLDSYISEFLNPGNYLLSVHACCLLPGDDIDGLHGYPPPSIYGVSGMNNDHGDYQITFTGDVTVSGPVIPVPPAVWLFGSGLVGLIGLARRKAA